MVAQMKLYINRSPRDAAWGGGNMFLKALHDYQSQNSELLTITESNPDHVLLMGLSPEGAHPSAEQLLSYASKSKTKVHLRINENDARKNTTSVDEELLRVALQCDSVIFVSNWLRDYFFSKDAAWKTMRYAVIHNGVDRNIFKPSIKIPNGKCNIVTHHWSDNPMKGSDVYLAIDDFVKKHKDNYTFTYIGRTKDFLSHTTIVDPLYGKALGDLLGRYDVYVSGSRFDPGPNHILESISCKLPTYVHPDGGGCVEFAGKDHVYKDLDDLKDILLRKSYTSNSTFVPAGWLSCVLNYLDFIGAT